MKAFCFTGYGKNLKELLSFEDLPEPSVGRNDVLISVRAAALNPADYKIIYGQAKLYKKFEFPSPIGFDVSGKVIAVGNSVQYFKVGDEVFSKVPWDQKGTVAPLIAVSEGNVGIKPRNISFEEAAGLPLVGCTVLEAFKYAKVGLGTCALIHAGSGGIGTFAIQYAKHLGAQVYTTTSTKNIELVKSLGAEKIIDYTKTDYREIANDVDVILESLGGKYTKEAIKTVKKGGKVIAIIGYRDNETLKSIGITGFLRFLNGIRGFSLIWLAKKREVEYKHIWTFPNRKLLDEIRTLVESEAVKPIIDKVYPFEEADKAMLYLETNRARGKVIIRIENEV